MKLKNWKLNIENLGVGTQEDPSGPGHLGVWRLLLVAEGVVEGADEGVIEVVVLEGVVGGCRDEEGGG